MRVERCGEFLVCIGACVLLAVDEERWCPIDAAAHAAKEIGLYLCSESLLRQRISQPEIGKPQGPAQAKNQGQAELVLICIKPVVHFPEEVMRSCVFGGPRRRLREWVRLAQWEVPENEPELLAEPLLRQLDVPEGNAAVGTLVVAIFDHCDRRVRGSLDVVSRRDRCSQHAHDETLTGSCSNASRMPSAPGLTAIGERKLQKIAPFRSITNSARSHTPSSNR